MSRLARVLLLAGIVGVVGGLSKVHAAYIAEPPYDYTGSSRFAWSLGFIVVLAVTAYGMGLPELVRDARSALRAAFGAPLLAALAMSLVQLAAGDALLPRFVVFGASLALVPWYLVCAAMASGGEARASERDQVVAVGSGPEIASLEAELGRAPERAASVAATLTLHEARQGGEGAVPPLMEVVERTGSTVIVLDRDAQSEPSIVQQAAELHQQGLRVRTLSLFYEQWLGKLPLSELERVSLLFDIGELHRGQYSRLKRMIDVAVAAVGLVVLVVVTPLVLVADLLGNRGPLLYRQPRVGRNGAEFTILKFRTMRPAADGDESSWTAPDDPRVTPVGRILRSTHIDELPQMVNILRGDLSVVGPRPEQPHYVAELAAKHPLYHLRHLVTPGLTGWAQVKYPYGADEADAIEKLQYEFFYLRHQGLGLDLRVMGRTIRSVFRGEGR
jgi:lipopolysaccharide/colanic/teichoic acid biosynthesis glycosyltransferase